MSRRVPPTAAAERVAQNQHTIKALLKLEGNKICADCKRNKHPRWASWNLGVFVCIRCSGIHRGMGTHISRVKSVDLDSWNDEQLQSVLRWGNARANKYWEAKLAAGHMPAEAKLENFIRTKYESKRWIMDGPMPDPSTLDADGDDDVPLNLVQEKAKIERSASQRTTSTPHQQQQVPLPGRPSVPNVDLFANEDPLPSVRPSTPDIPGSKMVPEVKSGSGPAPPPQTKPGESLLGLDFFDNTQQSNIGRPSSAASRPDLKKNILSLYSSAPKPQVPAPETPHNRQASLGEMSPSATSRQDSFGGLTDAFSGLGLPPSASAKTPLPAQSYPYVSGASALGNSVPAKSLPSAPAITSAPLAGGDFFEKMPAKLPPQQSRPAIPSQASPTVHDFRVIQLPTSTDERLSVSKTLLASDDFRGFASASPAPPPAPPPTMVSTPAPGTPASLQSAFHLSAPAGVKSIPSTMKPPLISQSSSAMFDPWSLGNDNAWSGPDSMPAKPPVSTVDIGNPPSHITPNDISGTWGAPISSSKKAVEPPTIAADEDFGGWTSASTTQTPMTRPAKASGGFGVASDPFDNPWG